MKVLKNLFVIVGICMLCLFNAGTANAENWIAKDSYAGFEWDADTVYSEDYGYIINFDMRLHEDNGGYTKYKTQIHQNELMKIYYGVTVDAYGNVLYQGPLNIVTPIFSMKNSDMFYDVINYYQKYIK